MYILRGDIYYIHSKGTWGAEIDSGRPAVIVSNNKGNAYSNTVEVVYLTSQEKKRDYPFHAKVMCRVPSIALCEQVCTVSRDRLGEFIRSVTTSEMAAIDKAIMVSLDLEKYATDNTEAVEELSSQVAQLKEANERLLKANENLRTKQAEVKPAVDMTAEVIKLTTERDTYKALYDDMVKKLIRKKREG